MLLDRLDDAVFESHLAKFEAKHNKDSEIETHLNASDEELYSDECNSAVGCETSPSHGHSRVLLALNGLEVCREEDSEMYTCELCTNHQSFKHLTQLKVSIVFRFAITVLAVAINWQEFDYLT